MTTLRDEHGAPITYAEAVNREVINRTADTRALVSLLVSAGLVSFSEWNHARVMAGSVVDQMFAHRRTLMSRRVQAMPHEYVDPGDEMEDRARRHRATARDEDGGAVTASEILEQVSREGWGSLCNPALAQAIHEWGAVVAATSFQQGVGLFQNLEVHGLPDED